MSEEALTMPPPVEAPVKRAPTVYFIDDSATMREVIKIAFRRENIHVITCADAASALAQFEQNRPDVVITDVIMPDQDGYSVCSQIKEHPEFGGIPVVLMSGVVNKSVADKAVSVKADELIRKPFQPQELIGRVKTLLAPKEAAIPGPRERSNSQALQNLFAQPPAPVVMPPSTESIPAAQPNVVPSSPAEPAWPRALAEAFTPLLPPLSPNSVAAPHSPAPQSLAPQHTLHPSNGQPAGSSSEMIKLRGEIARLELLVKKLQNELQLEREYTQAVEQQIRTLLISN
jgi:Response regulator containing a CheY-like receiver domain and a GGDEF domain